MPMNPSNCGLDDYLRNSEGGRRGEILKRSYLQIINNAEIKSAAIECSLIHKRSLRPDECEPDRYKGILRACHVWVSLGSNTDGSVNTIINVVIKSIYHFLIRPIGKKYNPLFNPWSLDFLLYDLYDGY